MKSRPVLVEVRIYAVADWLYGHTHTVWHKASWNKRKIYPAESYTTKPLFIGAAFERNLESNIMNQNLPPPFDALIQLMYSVFISLRTTIMPVFMDNFWTKQGESQEAETPHKYQIQGNRNNLAQYRWLSQSFRHETSNESLVAHGSRAIEIMSGLQRRR